jgi:hypothetical protein
MATTKSRQPDRDAGASQRLKPGYLHISRWWLTAFLAAILAPWVVLAMLAVRRSALEANGGARTGHVAEAGPHRSKPGPWGDLEYVPISIAPPGEFLVFLGDTEGRSKWHWANAGPDELGKLLEKAGLKAQARAQVLSIAKPDASINGLVVDPPAELVRTLSPEARRVIYGALAIQPSNRDQVNAFRIPAASFENWYGRLTAPAETKDLLRRMLYRNGRYYLFADVFQVLPSLERPEQRVGLLRALTEESTLLVRVRVNEGLDIRALAEYWGRGGRAKDVAVLLESLAGVPGGAALDICHLLPGFARRRLYTYPRPSLDPSSVNQDCHRAALNFFNDVPDESLADMEQVKRVLDTCYFPVYAEQQLGDLVLFTRDGRDVLHTAVYVADDILFTKNGSWVSSPWMLMKLDDMRDYYPCDGPLKIRYLRRKDL